MFASTKTSSPSGYQINRSLRFRASASGYLARTPSAAGSLTTWTWSGWIKRGAIGTQYDIFSSANGVNNYHCLELLSNDTIDFDCYQGGVTARKYTTQVFRDPSAWYHIVAVWDTTNATAANRQRLYVNGVRITSFSSSTDPALNMSGEINKAQSHRIGSQATANGVMFDGYMTEINFVDGQALDPSYFGMTDPITGVWEPKKYSGTYGTNGFYLNFADNSGATATTIGKDSSGNGNNWTPTNISVTAGTTYDSMLDVPTPYADGGNGRGNYATLSPLTGLLTLVNGNLEASTPPTTSQHYPSRGSIYVNSGKWYWEIQSPTVTASVPMRIGIAAPEVPANVDFSNYAQGYAYLNDGRKSNSGTTVAYGATYSNDIIGVALDLDAGTLVFYKNGVSQGTAYTGISGTYGPAISVFGNQTSGNTICNFGQRPFTYTPPSGFKALNTQNLPDPTIKKGSDWFDVKLDTGANIKTTAEATFSGDDLVWIKDRANANNHQLIDTIRGSTAVLQSNSTSAETTYSAPSGNSVAWVWKEGATPGFDIVTYTGNGANRTIAHSLGVAPSMMIVKQRTAASTTNWAVWHKGIANTEYLLLNSTAAKATGATYWNSTSPTSSVFSLGTAADVNTNTGTYVNYLFSEVEGFSRFGSYTGNGSTDGPFVYCGFRPRFILVKNTSTTGSWGIYDTARDTFNVVSNYLYPNLTAVEATTASLDVLSNGFKLRETTVGYNSSGSVYIFAAFAENPFKYSLAR